MRLPDRSIILDGGESTNLTDLPRPIFLIFLRHFGCVFCRYQVKQLQSHPELPLHFVCMESAQEAAAFRSRMKSPHRFISDPERELYRSFGVHEGSMRQVVTMKALAGGVRALADGVLQGRPTADPMQFAAAFLIDESGLVAWSKKAEDVSEVFSAAMLKEALASLDQGKS